MTNKSTITNPSRRAICARAEAWSSDGEIATVHKNGNAILKLFRYHGVSINWLACGDLQGGLRMARWNQGKKWA